LGQDHSPLWRTRASTERQTQGLVSADQYLFSFPGSAWERTILQALPAGSTRFPRDGARQSLAETAFPGRERVNLLANAWFTPQKHRDFEVKNMPKPINSHAQSLGTRNREVISRMLLSYTNQRNPRSFDIHVFFLQE
jgi:hypothetical protein